MGRIAIVHLKQRQSQKTMKCSLLFSEMMSNKRERDKNNEERTHHRPAATTIRKVCYACLKLVPLYDFLSYSSINDTQKIALVRKSIQIYLPIFRRFSSSSSFFRSVYLSMKCVIIFRLLLRILLPKKCD